MIKIKNVPTRIVSHDYSQKVKENALIFLQQKTLPIFSKQCFKIIYSV